MKKPKKFTEIFSYYKEADKKHKSFYVPIETFKHIESLSKALGESQSKVLCLLVELGLEKFDKGG